MKLKLLDLELTFLSSTSECINLESLSLISLDLDLAHVLVISWSHGLDVVSRSLIDLVWTPLSHAKS